MARNLRDYMTLLSAHRSGNWGTGYRTYGALSALKSTSSRASIPITLTRRFLQAMQPERDLVCLLRFRQEIPFTSDKSAGGPLRFDEGVTTKMGSSVAGISFRDIGTLSGHCTKLELCDGKDRVACKIGFPSSSL